MLGHRNLLGAMCVVWIALGPDTAVRAQSDAPPPQADASGNIEGNGGGGNGGGGSGLSMNDIEGLVAPIALYPDVLISQILPAATFPTEIVMASRWIADHPDLEGLDDQKWDPSVLSVCRYASVLDKMNTDLDWTNALGATFLDQPDDVFAAIQTLRQQAKDADILKNTPQQQVVEDEGAIRIVPAEEKVIYVPQYNPQIIYVDGDDDDDDDDDHDGSAAVAGAIGFGVGLAMGAWLDNDCDWHHHTVYACRPGYWGGWAYHGHVNWDNDWYAARGPQRGYVKGPAGGAAWGPNGRAVWGSHGGVWARPSGYAARPAYTGRYAGSGNYSGNRRTNVSGNTINRNNVNVNVDRGDRTNIQGGNRAQVNNRPSATQFNDQRRSSQINQSGDRGAQSRKAAASRQNSTVSQSSTRRPDSSRQSSANRSSTRSRQSSAYGSGRSSGQVQRSSSRGSSSRGGGGHRGGGGGRRR